MVTLIVSTTLDPASLGPASALLAMPTWSPGPSFQSLGRKKIVDDMMHEYFGTPFTRSSFSSGGLMSYWTDVLAGLDGCCDDFQVHSVCMGVRSYVHEKGVRLLQHDKSIVVEDNLDSRWEEFSNESVDNVIFLSKHTAVSNRPALTIHPIGVPHLKEGDVPPQGGKPGWAALPDPRMGPWMRLLKKIALSHNLIPEFEITMEATHHGPVTTKPTMFLEIGSTLEYWKRQDAAQVMALLIWEGLGLGGGPAVGEWGSEPDKKKVLLGLGGGHYVPRHMDVIMKENVWVGHLLSGYSLPMDDPDQSKIQLDAKDIGGTWKDAIRAALEATKAAYPGGEILAHLDQKSFKGWQKNAITAFLQEHSIKIGKPTDFSS